MGQRANYICSKCRQEQIKIINPAIMCSSNVVKFEKLSEPKFRDHADNAGISTSGVFPGVSSVSADIMVQFFKKINK